MHIELYFEKVVILYFLHYDHRLQCMSSDRQKLGMIIKSKENISLLLLLKYEKCGMHFCLVPLAHTL